MHPASMQEFEARTTLAGLPVTRLPSPMLSLLGKMPGGWGRAANTWPLLKQMWQRRSSDDLAFALMLAIDKFAEPVPSTQVNMGDAQSFVDMCTKCRKEIVACVQDPQCKKALDGLSACGLNDQVCCQCMWLCMLRCKAARCAICKDAWLPSL